MPYVTDANIQQPKCAIKKIEIHYRSESHPSSFITMNFMSIFLFAVPLRPRWKIERRDKYDILSFFFAQNEPSVYYFRLFFSCSFSFQYLYSLHISEGHIFQITFLRTKKPLSCVAWKRCEKNGMLNRYRNVCQETFMFDSREMLLHVIVENRSRQIVASRINIKMIHFMSEWFWSKRRKWSFKITARYCIAMFQFFGCIHQHHLKLNSDHKSKHTFNFDVKIFE